MHVKLIKNYLYLNDYKLKCSVGKRGINAKKREGDLTTPKSALKLKYVLYRSDRVRNLESKLKKVIIKKNMGWCDDYRSSRYNKIIKYPFNYRSEKLYRKDNMYDIVVVTDYNSNPTVKKRGSAIFLHIAKKKYKKTKGCIAISKRDMRVFLKAIMKKTIIKIF